MDYSKSGGPKAGGKSRSHAEHNAKGSRKNPFGDGADDKAALLARMKAAAEARKDKPED